MLRKDLRQDQRAGMRPQYPNRISQRATHLFSRRLWPNEGRGETLRLGMKKSNELYGLQQRTWSNDVCCPLPEMIPVIRVYDCREARHLVQI